MRKKKAPTITDRAVTAIDCIGLEVGLLYDEANTTLSCLCEMANRLSDINQDLGTKSALCGTLIAQLTRVQGDISKQCERNDNVKSALLDILMREKK